MANEPSGEGTPQSVGLVAVVALVAGVAATAGQVHPTGYAAWDVVLAGALAAGCVWAASTAPWWALTVVGIAAGVATARQQQWVLVGLAALAIALAAVTAKHALPVVAALSAGLSVAVLSRLEGGPFFGATSLFVLVLLTALVVLGLVHQPSRPRHIALIAFGALAAVMVIGAVGFGFAALQAKSSVSDGDRQARDGLQLLKEGDFIGGSFLLQQADTSFTHAQEQLDRPWALLARLVPVAAQNRATVVRLVDSAQAVTAQARHAADQIDPESLRIVDHHIDLAAVSALEEPVTELQDAIVQLQAALDEPVSPWVPDRVVRKLDHLGDDADAYRTQVDNLALAVQTAPGLLGADGPRRYFVAFSTPAETRSIGGFVGNYAILTVDQGAIELSDFGRSDDLRLTAPTGGMTIDLPADFRRRYGAFNFEDPTTGKVQAMAWKNIGITPDFPTMESVVAQMYQATFGEQIDGLILMDPYPLAKLLDYTGPQQVAGFDTPIDSANAADFILRDQYLLLEQAERVDLLEVLAEQTINELLAGAMPSPLTVAKDLGPFVHEHRLMVWTEDQAEQEMLDAVGLSGRFPPATGAADFGITFNNAAPNKADAYITHTTSVTQRMDENLGQEVVDVTLELTNTLTDVTLPATVVGNNAGLPPGTVYVYLSLYSPTEAIDASRDGESLGVETDEELGLQVAAAYVDLAPGATTSITFTFEAGALHPTSGWSVFVAPTAARTT